jgi:hypothetical protein
MAPPAAAELSSLGGRALGERLTEWGMSVIIESLLTAGPRDHDLADLAAANNVDDVLGASDPPTSPAG